ncbi:MAG: hypothetical protein CMJ31_02020 [Phycisphaerae bacterium]|nr:hypothetical protein [Phycisphaerae bacterium]
MDGDAPIILITGFEPSGDDHAASVVSVLKARYPDVRIVGWCGPRTRDAGAEPVALTGANAVMGLPGLAKIREHQRINRDIEAWLDAHRGKVIAHVPVDSPAANFPICAMAKKRGVPVVHLVAPQIWAWGSWRIGKLRRLTSFVCCVLPFEEQFFRERGVPAKFVGHPLFDEPMDDAAMDAQIEAWPEAWRTGSPKIAIMPGSRPAEIERNFPLLLSAYRKLEAEYGSIRGVIAATSGGVATRLREIAESPGVGGRGWPASLRIETQKTDAVARWSDVALVVSGTVTLQVSRHLKPMVIVYKSSRLLYELLGRWLVRTPFFSLPNLIVGREVVPELIPHFGGDQPILDRAIELIERPEVARRQVDGLGEVVGAFSGSRAAEGAADAIARVAGLKAEAPVEEAVLQS